MDSLGIVMPAYNEQETIEAVIRDWYQIVEQTSPESALYVINDGSKDATKSILDALQVDMPQLRVVHQDNAGHGAAVLNGYRQALDAGVEYIFQTDSDGQTVSDEFWAFWERRHSYAAQIGFRKARQDGWSRYVVTKILKVLTWSICGVWAADLNAPYRLMSREALESVLPFIPHSTGIPNVLLTVLLLRTHEDVAFPVVTFMPRQGGVNSINLKRIIAIGRDGIQDMKALRRTIKIL